MAMFYLRVVCDDAAEFQRWLDKVNLNPIDFKNVVTDEPNLTIQFNVDING